MGNIIARAIKYCSLNKMSVQKHNLRKIIDKKGIKDAELARRAKISPQALANFIKMRHGISDEKLINIANVLEVRPEEIIPGRSFINSKDEHKKLMQAIKITNQYYSDQISDDDLIMDIATELYCLLNSLENIKDKNSKEEFRQDISKKFQQGLAAKCVLDLLDK
jgi:transcriptional regulator with XRE-family HTH domain